MRLSACRVAIVGGICLDKDMKTNTSKAKKINWWTLKVNDVVNLECECGATTATIDGTRVGNWAFCDDCGIATSVFDL